MSELHDKLAKPLDAGRVKTRKKSGIELSYLEAHDVIRTANDIFGFGKWGHEVVELRQLDSVTIHNSDQKAGLCVGYVCVVRLTVEGCVPVSGVGYGDAIEYRESAAVTAHELAAKEAEADAMKRALKNYGDQFGLALYDKQAATSGRVTTSNGKPPTISKKQASRLFAIAGQHSVGLDRIKQIVVDVTGKESTADIPLAKYDEIVTLIEAEDVPFP